MRPQRMRTRAAPHTSPLTFSCPLDGDDIGRGAQSRDNAVKYSSAGTNRRHRPADDRRLIAFSVSDQAWCRSGRRARDLLAVRPQPRGDARRPRTAWYVTGQGDGGSPWHDRRLAQPLRRQLLHFEPFPVDDTVQGRRRFVYLLHRPLRRERRAADAGQAAIWPGC